MVSVLLAVLLAAQGAVLPVRADEEQPIEDNGTETVSFEAGEAGPAPSSLLLGLFFTSEEDMSDTLFVSFNGRDFYRLGYAFEDSAKGDSSNSLIVNKPVYDVNCLHDPALQYAKGGYWTMSGFTMGSGDGRRFVPMIAFSPDLVNWSYPNSGSSTNVRTSGLLPYGRGGSRDNADFDTVAPELFFDDNGDAYIVVCMGYYSYWHGEGPMNDRMSAYLIKANGLTPGSYTPYDYDQKGKQPLVSYSDAVPINLPDLCSDRIDGHLYKEGGRYYLSIKRNGIINEIWSIDDLANVSNASAWTKVRDIVTKGYEGPSLAKYAGRYFMYSDGLVTYSGVDTTGIFVSTSDSLSGNWTKNTPVNFYFSADEGPRSVVQRHGSVITVTDPAQINMILALYHAQGFPKYTAGMSQPFAGAEPQYFHCCWSDEKGKSYWYEDNKRQAVPGDPKNIIDAKYNTERGREIYDPGSNGWYWLDSIYDGAKAVGKEVWMPYIYQDEKNWDDAAMRSIAYESDPGMGECVYNAMRNGDGKWVRYNEYGAMLKGWVKIEGALADLYPDQAGNVYYYDTRTGLMAKGSVQIGGKSYYFDPITGVLQ